MAVLASNNPTLLDHAKALDPDGQIAAVTEILHQTNEMMADMTFLEGNLPTGHRSVIRTGIPAPTWRKLYGGVQPTKSTREQVTDTCGMLEAYNEIDVELANLNGNSNEFRLSEAQAQIEGISQTLAETTVYGSTELHPERFDGLAPRFDQMTGADNSENVLDGGGSGSDNASIWLIVWGPNTCHGIVPKGSTAGITVTDKGQVTSENAAVGGGLLEVYRMHFQLKAGLCVKDWRYVVRIANIDRSELSADGSTGANIPDLMFEAMERVPNLGGGHDNPASGRAAFYMDRQVRTTFRQQLANATKQSTLSYENVGGHRAMMFNEVPVRRVDRLAVDEARVV